MQEADPGGECGVSAHICLLGVEAVVEEGQPDRGNHPLVGRSAPDFELADGTKLGEYLGNGRGLLLDFDAGAPLQALARRWRDRITYVAREAQDRLGLSAVLVRPDGIVAWAGEAAPNDEDVARTASRWFGEPDAVSEPP